MFKTWEEMSHNEKLHSEYYDFYITHLGFKMQMFVQCRECGERHTSKEVETIDIEEGSNGEDILTFVCPETGNETKSIVFCTR